MSGRVGAVTVPPVVFQCRLQKLEFIQWHSSVGLFQLSFSNGVPAYPASIHWVAQWYPSVHWFNQWHSSAIPVYTGPASVHWLRVRDTSPPLQWRHNGYDGVSNHQGFDCLLNCLFRHRSKKTSKLCVTGLCEVNSPGIGEFPHKRPVTRKMSPFDGVIMSPGLNELTIAEASDFDRQKSIGVSWQLAWQWSLNSFRPRQNGRRFADDTFKRIFLDENARISMKISLKFVPQGPINNIPALVQIMAWRLPGDKPLSEPMMICLLTHICVTRPQWWLID